MSVPFSNTHLRVPRGFGTVLEGLAREVLRDQPEDIPAYAARYFEVLIKEREDSGVDPAEWAARLEDRFYNNHAFKNTGAHVEKETAPEETISKEKSCKFQTEDNSGPSEEASSLSNTQAHVSEKTNSPEITDDEEKCCNKEMSSNLGATAISERTPSTDTQSDEPSCTDEKIPSVTTVEQGDRSGNESDSENVPEKNMPQSDSNPAGLLSSGGISNVDVHAEELGEAEDERSDQQGSALVDEKTAHSEEEDNIEDPEPAESFVHSGLADVDVCATELGETERVMEGDIVQDSPYVIKEEEEIVKHQLEESVVELSFSQDEISQGNQQEAEDQAQKIKEKKTTMTEASKEETNEGLAHNEGSLYDSAVPKEDSLVEISFEDVPEAQGITAVGERQPELETSLVLLNNTLESQEKEESKEFSGSSTDENISDSKDHIKPEMKEIKNKVNSEEKGMKSQHEGFDLIKEKTETNNDLNDSDNDDTEKCVESISTSDQVTTEAVKEIQEETADKNEDIKNMGDCKYDQNQESEKETQSNDPDFKDDKVTQTGGGDDEGIFTEGQGELADQEFNDGKVEPNPSQVTQLNTSVAGMEEESETFEESAQHPPQENEESQKTLSVPQKEEQIEEMTDSEEQEKTTVMDKETASLTHSADCMDADHQEEERPDESEKESSEFVSKSDKEECNRPQEEEDIMDIPLDDPEANRAAAKIQAGFRGHMTRKKLKPEDKAEGEEVSSTGEVLNGSQGVSETGRSGAVERDDTSVPEQ